MVRRAALLPSDSPVATSSSTIVGVEPAVELRNGGLRQRRGQRARIETVELGATEQRLAGGLHRIGVRLPVHQRGHLRGQPSLRPPADAANRP